MDITQLVESFTFRFGAAGVDNAKRVAEELIAHVLECEPLEIYMGAASATPNTEQFKLIKRLEPLAERIENGEPLQYAVGHVNFFGLNILCDPRALIPRPETEILVEEVLTSNMWNRDGAGPATVVDVGTGTGCVALALARQRPDANFKAVDISPDALDLAKQNAERNDLADRVFWMRNNLLERFAPESADIIVANPPYISTENWKALSPSVRDHEPRTALDSGPSGMELIAELATQARYVLVPGGMLFLEFGFDQGDLVASTLENLGYASIEIKHDLAGHDRVAIAVNP